MAKIKRIWDDPAVMEKWSNRWKVEAKSLPADSPERAKLLRIAGTADWLAESKRMRDELDSQAELPLDPNER